MSSFLARVLAFVLVGLTLLSPAVARAAQCGRPGADGAAATLTGIVNGYWPGLADVSAGATTVLLGASSGSATPIAAGDLLLVIQMQDTTITRTDSSAYGTIGTDRAGLFEFARAAGTVSTLGGTLTLVGGSGGGLLNAYNTGSATTTQGQQRFQIVRVPQYASAALGSGLTASAWDGSRGGVLAIDVRGDLTLAGGSIDVSGKGFRGGGGRQLTGADTSGDYATSASLAVNAAKGEGVAGTPRYVNNSGALLDSGVEGYPTGSQGRGAPANGGGGGTDGDDTWNDENTGGGGGGGRGAGGRGGYAWCSSAPVGCDQTGGVGGRALALTSARLTLGGGGGAGTNNNGTGTPGSGLASSGAAGGGIVLVRAGRLVGTATVSANGAAGNTTVGNDASGGGGGGGSILVTAGALASGAGATFNAKGGAGGSNSDGASAHGPGGGGGGGHVVTSFAATADVSGGSAGTTVNGGSYGASYGALAGSAGGTSTVAGSGVTGASAGYECTPAVSKDFASAAVPINGTTRLTLTLSNPNPTLAMTSAAMTDTYPAQIRNAAVTNAATTCGGTVSAATSGGSVAISGATIPAAGSCTVAVDVTGTAAGSYVNTIAAGGLTASIGAVSLSNPLAATDSLVVTAPLTATKSALIYSDPINGVTNPKAIPGSVTTFTITVTNPGATATDANTIVLADAMPSGTSLVVGDVFGAGTGPVRFVQGSPSSGLTYSYASAASATDDLAFSSDGGSSFTYTPSADANGVDPAVTHIRVNPKGAHAANGVFSIQFRVRLR